MALLKAGLHPAASAALVQAGVGAGRVGQTIGNAAASAGTHAADGIADGHSYCAAVDLRINNGGNFLSDSQVKLLIAKLSEVGFAAYFRNPGHDGWPAQEIRHVHAVFAGCPMKRALRNQVHDYLHGKNGLASHGAYTFFQPTQNAQNTIRNLFLANNQATNVTGNDDFLGNDLPADDEETAAEYDLGHDHAGLDSDEDPGDNLAAELSNSG